MLLLFTLILLVVVLSRFFEQRFRIPFALTAIVSAYCANLVFDLSAFGDHFPDIVYLMLPIILIPDVLGVSRSELKHNLSAIIYLSIVAVLISIFLAIIATFVFTPEQQFTIGMLLALFTPLMATDVVSVSSIFAKFKLPEKLKLYAEGESLFNDITAMIIFFFIALPLIEGQSLQSSGLHLVLGKLFIESILIGLVAGMLGYYAFKFFTDNVEQFLTLYIMASMAFTVGEHLEVSGMLGVVVTILLFKYLFDKEGQYKKIDASMLTQFLNSESTSEGNFRAYRKEAHYLGLFANGVIFIAIANVVDLDLLWQYHLPILAVFALTTIIRFLVVTPLIWWNMHPFRWAGVLTFAGMKGGLAIIMVFALPDNFIYKEAFMSIVVGVVILSMFVNTALLMLFLRLNNEAFILDTADEHNTLSGEEAKQQLKKLLQKDPQSQAYNALVFEELIEKEMARSQRYHAPFALLAFESDKADVTGQAIMPILRKSDYFGRLEKQRFCILATHSDIDSAMIVAQKLRKRLGGKQITIAEYAPGDNLQLLYEKIDQGFKTDKDIAIEV